MAKIATAVDKTAIQGLMSELAALNATTSQRQLNKAVQVVLDKLRYYIGALMSRSKREGDDEGMEMQTHSDRNRPEKWDTGSHRDP